jgi:hypothetical protein
MKQYAIECMEKSGSFEYTRKAILKFSKQARDMIHALGGNVELIQVLDQLDKDV